jgi:hypothetical protein
MNEFKQGDIVEYVGGSKRGDTPQWMGCVGEVRPDLDPEFYGDAYHGYHVYIVWVVMNGPHKRPNCLRFDVDNLRKIEMRPSTETSSDHSG